MKGSYKYIKKNVFIAFVIYSLGIALGVLIYKNKTLDMVPQRLGIAAIFLNNIKTAFLILIVGLITVGIGSALLMLINGAVLGGAVMGVVNAYSFKPIISGILPHFMFETIGLAIFTAISFESLKLLLNVITKREMQKVYLKKDLFLIFCGTVFLLLAAIIEGTVSRV